MEHGELPEIYDDEDVHDSIVKLPGRHYPKLPYVLFSAEDTTDGDNRGQSYGSSKVLTSSFGHMTTDVNNNFHQRTSSHGNTQSVYEPVIAPLRGSPDERRPAKIFSAPGFFIDDGIQQDRHAKSSTRTNEDWRQYGESNGRQYYHTTTTEKTTQIPEVRQSSPHFDRNQSRTVVVQKGKTANLACRVRELGDQSVSNAKTSCIA